MSGKKILFVDDDPFLVKALKFQLEKAGYDVAAFSEGQEALDRVDKVKPDLIISDVMMPGFDGLELCKRFRKHPYAADLPIIMLSARDSSSDEVVGLEHGADDYIKKPFDIGVVLTRIEKLLKRYNKTAKNAPASDVIERGPLMIDLERHKVTLDGNQISLTGLEFKLLHYLAQKPGRVYSRDDLVTGVWNGDVTVVSRAVDVHITALRKKLAPHEALIETVRGAGYRFKEDF